MSSFLERVVPWPESEDAPGYVNLHYATKRSDGKKFWVGKPFKTFAEFTRQLWSWYVPNVGDADFYFCTSMQKTATTNKQGKAKAVRLQANVAALKSIWADIDVKAKDGYPTIEAAHEALEEFLCSTKLPPPTFIVGSGGGLHIYWTFSRAISLQEWQPIANLLKNALIMHGVKCDTGCTVDSVRILRVPGTLNHKTNPPKKVELLTFRDTDYTLTEDIAIPLLAYAPTHTAGAPHLASPAPITTPNWPELKKPASLKDVVMEGAGDGLEPEKFDVTLNAEAIFRGCPFFSETHATGGAENANPLWNLTTLAATFLPDGESIAHDLAKGHSSYTEEETQELYERKQREVEERGLRWPSCKAFESSGSTQCATCPLAGAIKSPLNLGLTKRVAAPVERDGPVVGSVGVAPGHPGVPHVDSECQKSYEVQFRGQEISQKTLYLPDGYFVNQKGVICVVAVDGRGIEHPEPLFLHPVWAPWSQLGDAVGNMRGIHFMTVGPRDRGDVRVFIPAELFHSDDKWKIFAREGCSPNLGRGMQYMRAFLMAWQTEIEKNRGSTETRAFGWQEYNKLPNHAFVFGERQWNYDGTEEPSGLPDATLRNDYKPRGTIEVWQEAADHIWRQKRPELEVLVASAFAAPLVVFSGQYGGTLSAWGSQTGAGKTTALTIAAAVWGVPKRIKEVLGTTQNSLVGKVGALGNLPIYWDEIKTTAQMETLEEVLFSLNEGREKGRMKADTTQRPQKEWQTLLVTGSNKSIYDHMVSKGHTTSAGLVRVLEVHIPKRAIVGGAHHAAVDQLVRTGLNHNCGLVGLEYGRLLAARSPELPQMMLKTITEFTDATGGDRDEERVWTAVAACCFLGATLANGAGLAKFRLSELREYLVDLLLQSRDRVTEEALEGESDVNIDETLTAFFREHTLGTIVTDTCITGRHNTKQPVTVLRALPVVGARPLTVQFVKNKLMVRISRRRFREWLDHNDQRNYSAVIEGLKRMYGMAVYHGHLGAGCVGTACGGKERLLDLKIRRGTGLWEILSALCMGNDGKGLPETAEEAA